MAAWMRIFRDHVGILRNKIFACLCHAHAVNCRIACFGECNLRFPRIVARIDDAPRFAHAGAAHAVIAFDNVLNEPGCAALLEWCCVFHNDATVAQCVLLCKKKMHAGANFFQPLLFRRFGSVLRYGLGDLRPRHGNAGKRGLALDLGQLPAAGSIIAV